ncbi:MAG TPA: hypothetical protein VEW07_11360 [Solirubrobacterales bacterium]|nr:hypothetical protein [Solirubrobacterales bacterium]
MELDTLILADAASTPNDKFYIHGGGFSRYELPGLPAPMPLGVLLRVRVSEADMKTEHVFRIAFIGPTGLPNVPPVDLVAFPPEEIPPLLPGEERFAHVALQIPAMAVREGLYHLELHIDGELARKIPLPVVVTGEVGDVVTEHEWPQPPQSPGDS